MASVSLAGVSPHRVAGPTHSLINPNAYVAVKVIRDSQIHALLRAPVMIPTARAARARRGIGSFLTLTAARRARPRTFTRGSVSC